MIQKAEIKNIPLTQDCRFAPNIGDIVFIINNDIVIHGDEIIEDFDVEYYKKIFKIIQTVQ